MKNQFLYALSLVMALSISSCKPDATPDTEVPVIESLTVLGMEADSYPVPAGSYMTAVVTLSDNQDLGEARVNIHPADDGHTHPGTVQDTIPNVGVWTNSQTFDISGTASVINLNYTVPTGIQGQWHLEVLVMDAAGNTAEEKFVTLLVP
jgi:hypothetical protein